VRGEVVRGREAIVASYRASSEWARANLASIAYTSEVEPARGDDVGVLYTDDLTARDGARHIHRCRQVYSVGEQGRVVVIVHDDLPGEAEALQAFFEACGIARD
jgi:hypothetical protein